MDVTVRLFASLRERAGTGTLALELGDGATVADAIAELRSGALAGLPDNAPFVTAVAREYVTTDHALTDGDELALVPPVSGGAGEIRHVEVTGEPVDAEAMRRLVADPSTGATVVFCGTTREVPALEYEAYVEMAEEKIRQLARDRHRRARAGRGRRPAPHRDGRAHGAERRHRGLGRPSRGGVRRRAGAAGPREVRGADLEAGAPRGRPTGVGRGDASHRLSESVCSRAPMSAVRRGGVVVRASGPA